MNFRARGCRAGKRNQKGSEASKAGSFMLESFLKELCMRKYLASFFVLLALALPAYAVDEPTITTSGTATVYVVPDKAVLSIGLASTDRDIEKAKTVNEAEASRVLKAIKALGIVDADIATDRLSVGTHYDEASRKPDGFTASRNYAISVKDLTLVEKLVDAVVKNGGNVPGVDLQTSDMRKYRDQARQLAIRAAKEKAVALAKELECAVGRPRTIVEGGTSSGYGGYRGMGQNSEFVVPAQVPDTPETLPLGRIPVEATVSVTFELK